MRKIFVALATLLAAQAAVGQVGITGGFNIAKYDYVSDRGPLLSFNAGLTARKALGGSLVWAPSLTYTMKGATVYPVISGIGNIEKYSNRIGYLQLAAPVYAGLSPAEAFRIDIGAGPYVAYAVRARQIQHNYDGTSTNVSFRIGGKDKADFRPLDAGLRFGAGWVWAGRLGFHVLYDLGLANVNATSSQPRLKMRTWSLNFSYFFANEGGGRKRSSRSGSSGGRLGGR